MESTLEVARRAVEADANRDWATAYALYVQAAAELDSFAASAAGTRTPEELQGAWARNFPSPGALNAVRRHVLCADAARDARVRRAAIRAKAQEYRLRSQALAPSVRDAADAHVFDSCARLHSALANARALRRRRKRSRWRAWRRRHRLARASPIRARRRCAPLAA